MPASNAAAGLRAARPGDPPAWTGLGAMIIPPARRRDLLVELLDGEMLLIDPRVGHTTRLNQTARLVWECCDGQTSTLQIAAHLADHYNVDPDTALADVEQTIAACAAQNLFCPRLP